MRHECVRAVRAEHALGVVWCDACGRRPFFARGVQLVIIVARVKKDLIWKLRVRTWEIKADDHVLEVGASLRHETPSLVLSVQTLVGSRANTMHMCRRRAAGRVVRRPSGCWHDLPATSSATSGRRYVAICLRETLTFPSDVPSHIPSRAVPWPKPMRTCFSAEGERPRCTVSASPTVMNTLQRSCRRRGCTEDSLPKESNLVLEEMTQTLLQWSLRHPELTQSRPPATRSSSSNVCQSIDTMRSPLCLDCSGSRKLPWPTQ